MKREILSVSELTQNIRRLLEGQFPSVWVSGEISNFKFHSSGHMYFSLKDEQAQIACVMFRQENAKLLFEPKEGMAALAFGRVSVYPVRGQYQLYIEQLEPKGVGALQLKFQQLKEKLQKEGLFDALHKVELPFLPARIGVVTSIDGAALRDILHVIDRRFENAHVVIYPVPVQGAGAAGAIAEAVADLNAQKAADVLILARGGGSLEDLWAFNEEVLARAIFASEIPVISAVGHETDFTIADFVADLRAPTPSAAAELVLPVRDELLARVAELKKSAKLAFLNFFKIKAQETDELKKDLAEKFRNFYRINRERILALLGKLEVLGPLAVLRRGFSVTMLGETIVTSVEQLRSGDKVRTRLDKGVFVSQVKEISD